MAVTAIALPGASYTAQYWRQADIGARYAHTGNSITVHPGVVVGMEVVGLVGAQAQVHTGICVVSPADGLRGSYQVASDAIVTLTLTPPDTVYSRIDAVYVRVRDAAFGDASTGATIEATPGTPSVSPTAPPIPNGTLLLAHVTVPPNGQAAAVDRRLWTSAIGGAMSGTRDQRLALPTTHLRPGQTYTENADSPTGTPPGVKGQTWRWNGSMWTPQFPQSALYFLGYIQRAFNFDYQYNVLAGRVFAFPIRKATGPAWNEQNDLNGTTTNGFNWVAPYPGSYRIKVRAAGRETENTNFALGIWRNANFTTENTGGIGTAYPGATLLRETRQDFFGAAAGPQPIEVDIALVRLNQGDSISVTVWHIAGATKGILYENPHAAYLEITRWGD